MGRAEWAFRAATAVAGLAGPSFLRGLAATWNYVTLGSPDFRKTFRNKRPAIFALWHQNFLPMLDFFRNVRGAVMVSRSRDGDVVASVLRRMGFQVARGSSSRGGSEAMRELLRLLKREPLMAGFMADGPRGPYHVVKPGAVVAARETGLPLFGGACAADRAWFAKSWDRTEIPQPFATVYLEFTPALRVPPDANEEECERIRRDLEARMCELDRRVRARATA